MSDESLLPPNRSALEVNLEQVSVRASEVEAPFDTLWDPFNCDARLLPFLAWALGVREWSASWPESRKRLVIASARDVRRRAGTVAAVEEAIATLGIDDLVYEDWFEYGGQPGHYRLRWTLDEAGMTPEELQEVIRVVRRAGRFSAKLDAETTTVAHGAQYWASGTNYAVPITVEPYQE